MATVQELRAAQNAIAQALAQHTSYQYRASSLVVNKVNTQIDNLADTMAGLVLIGIEGLTPTESRSFIAGRYNTKRLQKLQSDIAEYSAGVAAALSAEWKASAPALVGYEVNYVSSLLDEAFEDLSKPSLTQSAAYKAAMAKPMTGSAPYGGQLVQSLLDNFDAPIQPKIYNAIRGGLTEGQTSDQIVKAIRGTKALNYQDGQVHATKIDAERMVRTARSHMSNQAYLQTYEDMGFGYVIVSAVIDGRVSKFCASIDGTVYRTDEPFAAPPFHIFCRTVLIPSLDGELIGQRPFVRALKVKGGYTIDEEGNRIPKAPEFRSIGDMTKKQREAAGLEVGQVAATTNYAKWFGNQDAAFQKEWLGPKRYALLKDGNYTIDRFVDPINKKQYTLAELELKDAETFRQVFGIAP